MADDDPDDAATIPTTSTDVLVIGGGIGGLAAALALQRHGLRVLVYERDAHCEQRKGYGLTLSNVSALAALGVEDECRAINSSCVSDCHWVFDAGGAVLGYFGIAFTKKLHEQRGNLRVPRLVLRRTLFERLAPNSVRWGWRCVGYDDDGSGVTALFERAPAGSGEPAAASEARVAVRCSVLVGADGVRSVCRALKFGDPHRYVGVVVVLGLCALHHPLLHCQGFYTLDGQHRLFTMPYEPLDEQETAPPADGGGGGEASGGASGGRHSTMWQISLALADEAAARALCAGGGAALLAEMVRRCGHWHPPVPAMLAATHEASVWGTPLYDREPMPLRRKNRLGGPAPWSSRVTLLGDAAHCMTPFKGQGANQALADAPLLATYLAPALLASDGGDAPGGDTPSGGKSRTERIASALACFEREMTSRSEAKVRASRAAAKHFHSPAALDLDGQLIEGVADTARLLAAMRAEGVGARCAGELEARAIALQGALASSHPEDASPDPVGVAVPKSDVPVGLGVAARGGGADLEACQRAAAQVS